MSLFIIVKTCIFKIYKYNEIKDCKKACKIWIVILILFIFIGYILADTKCSKFDELKNYAKSLENNSKICLTGVAKNVRIEKNNFNGFAISFILVLDDMDIVVKQNIKANNKIISEHLNGKNNINGKDVYVIGKYVIPSHARNPRTFDYYNFLISKGVGLQFDAENILFDKRNKNNNFIENDKNKISDYENEIDISKFKSYVMPNKKSCSSAVCRHLVSFYYQIYGQATSMRDNFLRELSSHIDKDKLSIIDAICFGNKSNMQEEIYESYQKNGTAHILATSGLHLGLLYLLLKKILFLKREKCKSVIVLIVLFFYCLMAEFTISILRAYIMIVVDIVGNVFHRRVSIVTSASFSLIIILFINPLSILDIGLQMSFLAIYIIAMIIRKIDYILPKSKKIIKVILTTLIMQLVMLPYTMYNFNYFSLSAFVANIIIGIIGTLLLVFSILLIGFSFAWTIPQLMKLYIAELVDVFNVINKWFYHDGILVFDVVSPPIWFICVFYLLLFFIFSEGYYILKKRKLNRIRNGIVCIIVIISAIIGLWYSNEFDETKVIFVDVGQGSCVFFKTDDGENILIDGGGNENYDVGKKILKPFLLKNRISKIDYAFVTHEDIDHVDGIYSLYRDGMIDKVVLSDIKHSDFVTNGVNDKNTSNKNKRKYKWDEKNVIRVSSGYKFTFNNNEYIEVLHPDAKGFESNEINLTKNGNISRHLSEENDNSLVILIKSNNMTFLATGDISSNVENFLVDNNFLKKSKVDILLLPHHGSKYSSSERFLEYIQPSIAIIQVGRKNRYGHPSEEVLERCMKNDIILYRNDYMGAIGIINRSNKLKVITNIVKE
ncbi:MAG: DNA internalization-related competence protein ComEC/Rec2 [Eubacteriales bacterium]|nr:DNA internalization-related competence protein ComEC/Rec2 [Eubacteriales bacterium]MDY3332612.1 DNA internalization-related competence protein ComEC/Rec2 [Gallibacter sp.]